MVPVFVCGCQSEAELVILMVIILYGQNKNVSFGRIVGGLDSKSYIETLEIEEFRGYIYILIALALLCTN